MLAFWAVTTGRRVLASGPSLHLWKCDFVRCFSDAGPTESKTAEVKPAEEKPSRVSMLPPEKVRHRQEKLYREQVSQLRKSYALTFAEERQRREAEESARKAVVDAEIKAHRAAKMERKRATREAVAKRMQEEAAAKAEKNRLLFQSFEQQLAKRAQRAQDKFLALDVELVSQVEMFVAPA